MSVVPCYDRVNRIDCPARALCKLVGRAYCLKWTNYEIEHSQELADNLAAKEIANASYNSPKYSNRKYMKAKYHHNYSHRES